MSERAAGNEKIAGAAALATTIAYDGVTRIEPVEVPQSNSNKDRIDKRTATDLVRRSESDDRGVPQVNVERCPRSRRPARPQSTPRGYRYRPSGAPKQIDAP